VTDSLTSQTLSSEPPAHRIVLSGAELVLPDRVISPGTLVIEQGVIVEIVQGARPAEAGTGHVDLTGHLIVPGFIDVHVHGLEGHDTLTGPDGIDAMARRLPRYGVTGFCPTSIACGPQALTQMLAAIRRAHEQVVGLICRYAARTQKPSTGAALAPAVPAHAPPAATPPALLKSPAGDLDHSELDELEPDP